MLGQLNKTAIYMRLSRDDEKCGESTSIENQRIILLKFVSEHGGKVVGEYVDDGWSGTNFDRPEVKKMLLDAQSGKIDTIVVKDLSRFGRNYIQVGQYVDYIFPAYGIRFIAIGDNIDTSDRSSAAMDMMPIMNVFNEWHAANTSKKIRAVLLAKQRAGSYTNWQYPYGYKAGTDDARTAVIDEEAASVVRRIFDMRLEGLSARAIARTLTESGVPNPATHFVRKGGGKSNRRCAPYWVPKTVADILSNPVYIGTTVQHKTTHVSYKNHAIVPIPESERIVKENAHAAIVDAAVWERVQRLRAAPRGRADKARTVHPLSGLLVCPDCGKKLKYTSAKNGGCFVCRTYADLGKAYCPSHRIAERALEEIVLCDIQSMINAEAFDEEKVRARFWREREKTGQNRKALEKQIKTHQTRLTELDELTKAAFEASVLRGLPESACTRLCRAYQVERAQVQRLLEETERQLLQSGEDAADAYVQRVRHYAGCETLTRELCLQLIERITVGEQDADGRRELHIYYKCAPPKALRK